MTTNEIRQKFLEFFNRKEHKVITSDTLVPKDDPTVLFTTAGMQQFKRQFLGHITDFKRAATSQKCLRTDDLQEVGKTDFHHTFFEMLGNFSFGDYFKKEAIQWAWEFLTNELKMPEEKLWVTVYEDDEEAKNIWIHEIKIPHDKVVTLGDKSNFWPSNAKHDGPNGPCGPCSEIFFDFGENPDCISDPCNPACECGRFSEIWNLVFTQFERQEGGILIPLPSNNIDTGMGLERLAAIVQGKKNNFEIDIFEPILRDIAQNIETDGVRLNTREKRVTADHLRAITIGIADGVIPSNEGRGYVIKKLIIDVTDITLQAGKKSASVYTLVDATIEAMKGGYPELDGRNREIADIIRNIETAYIKVRNERIPELSRRVKKLIISSKEKNILCADLGKLMFSYRDTYGLTLSTIELTLRSNGVKDALLKVARSYFEKLMGGQKEQSRQSSKMVGDVFTNTELNLTGIESNFIGYDHVRCNTRILKLFSINEEICEAHENQDIIAILKETPFYAESGGQIGDIGTLTSEAATIEVHDTQKIDNIHIHMGRVIKGTIKADDAVVAMIDEERRLSIMRNHTATHLLQGALREVLGETVKQQGSLVAEDRLRFDFTYHKALSEEQILHIEKIVNRNILECSPVRKEFLPIEEAKKLGALAFFAEKYGDIVRVVSISDYSKEFCGGTHLDSTGQIGLFRITQENAVAQGIRRLEAKTGTGALEQMYEQEEQIRQAAKTLKSNPKEFVVRLREQSKRIKALEKYSEQLTFENIKSNLENAIHDAEKINDITLFCQTYSNVTIETLRKVADFVKKKLSAGIIVLGAKHDKNASILVAVTDDAINKGYMADKIIAFIAPLINGTGGGRHQLAQAGSKEPDKLDAALTKTKQLLKEYK